MGLKDKLHTTGVANAGLVLGVGSSTLPLLALFMNATFVNGLLFGDQATRIDSFHQLLVAGVVSAALIVSGLLAAYLGKGPICSESDSPTPPSTKGSNS